MLGKLREGLSVILGDEMGLGKTIQTAVFLQVGATWVGGRVGCGQAGVRLEAGCLEITSKMVQPCCALSLALRR